MRISDWSSYVGSSDLAGAGALGKARHQLRDLSHAALVGAGDDRRDEPLVGGDGNGDVGRAETVDVIAVHLVIPLLHLHQRKRAGPDAIVRSEQSRLGKECVSTFRSRWSTYTLK